MGCNARAARAGVAGRLGNRPDLDPLLRLLRQERDRIARQLDVGAQPGAEPAWLWLDVAEGQAVQRLVLAELNASIARMIAS